LNAYVIFLFYLASKWTDKEPKWLNLKDQKIANKENHSFAYQWIQSNQICEAKGKERKFKQWKNTGLNKSLWNL